MNVLLVLVGLHVLAAVVYLVWKTAEPDRRHVYRPQAARRLCAARASLPPTLTFASGRLALSLLIVAAAIVYFIVRAGG